MDYAGKYPICNENTRILRCRVGSRTGHVKRRRFGLNEADQNDIVLIGYLRQISFKKIHFFFASEKKGGGWLLYSLWPEPESGEEIAVGSPPAIVAGHKGEMGGGRDRRWQAWHGATAAD
ncbi:hypothetical protein V6Z11_A11G165900 [Gossypium hirsutum]